MRFVWVGDWGGDRCPHENDEATYPQNTYRHDTPKPPKDDYPPGDRLYFMSCKNCDAVIWGFHEIHEEPDILDLLVGDVPEN